MIHCVEGKMLPAPNRKVIGGSRRARSAVVQKPGGQPATFGPSAQTRVSNHMGTKNPKVGGGRRQGQGDIVNLSGLTQRQRKG